MKRSLLLTLLAIAGTAILAVALVGFRLSQGGLDYSAFAHFYDYNNNTEIDTGDIHLEIDKIKDGDTWCDPVDTEDEVEVDSGAYEVAVCLTSAGQPPRAFDVNVTFDPDLNECQPVSCTGTCLDGNPDANDGTTTWGTDLGDGWDCASGGQDPPTCNNTTGVAHISCVSSSGGWTLPNGAMVSAPVAVVTFEAIDEGTDVLDLENIAFYGAFGLEMGSCNPAISSEMPCVPATDEKVPPPTDTPVPPTDTPAPPTDTPTPPPGVRMEKVLETTNVWIMADGCTVPEEGKGCLAIEKWIYEAYDADSPNDSDSEPEGVGAWEEQIKFDHKVVSVSAVPDNTWLESEGRTAICTMTIISENWILTGCVTKDTTEPPAEGNLGPNGDGLIEIIYVEPKTDDLIYRSMFRPTKMNGILTDIVDENCEVTDTLGEELPGTLPGGLAVTCGDAHISVRMLEGDLDLDCDVDVEDDQAIAFRYGTVFGMLMYDEWFDLAPVCVDGQCVYGIPDFDIDIKDLQFVFGRNWSTCQDPIPDDQALPLDPPQPPLP